MMENKLVVEIFAENECIDERSITTKDGRDMVLRAQIAYVNLGGKFPEMFEIPMEEGQPAYKAGKYEVLTSQSCEIDKYKKLSFKRGLILVHLNK